MECAGLVSFDSAGANRQLISEIRIFFFLNYDHLCGNLTEDGRGSSHWQRGIHDSPPQLRCALKLQQLSLSSRGDAGVWRDLTASAERIYHASHGFKIGTKFEHFSTDLLLLFFSQHGILEAMRDVADQLQRAAREPPGDRGHGAGVWPGTNPAGRGPTVPAAQQLETSDHQPERD